MKSDKVSIRIDNIIDDYMSDGDIAHENANTSRGPSGLLLSVGGHGLKKHNLQKLKEYNFDDLVELHNNGGIHIHDLSLGLYTPYCSAHSLSNLLSDGMNLGITCKPAAHFSSAINHMVNWIGTMSNAFSGAVAFNSVDTLLAPYAYKIYLDYKKAGCPKSVAFQLTRKEIYQNIQSFIYHLNFNTRYGDQTPFSNISIDITIPDDMKDQLALVGGKELSSYYDYTKDGIRVNNKTYGDLWEWQRLVSEAILDTLIDGDGYKSFTFPVLTINVTEDLFSHSLIDRIAELTAKFGYPFFQNFINGKSGGIKISPEDTRAMCCRLNLNLKDIANHTGGLFGNADNTGSIQVVTISLPYQALQYRGNYDSFKLHIEKLIDRITEEQIFKRQIVNDQFDKKFFNLTRSQFRHGFDTFFQTIGFIGLWECVEILTNDSRSFLTDTGLNLAKDILTFMRERIEYNSKKYSVLINLEATPAESATYKLAKKAIKKFGAKNVPFRGTKIAPYFTNSHHIPVEYQSNLVQLFKTQTALQTIPSGGTVQHFTTGEQLTKEDVISFIKTVCNTEIPYFSINTVFSVCPIHGYIPGYHEYCPYCTKDDIARLEQENPARVELC